MNKTSKVEFTVELVRIITAVAIAYAVALITLFVISDDPVYIIQQFILGPFSSPRRIGSIINLAIPFTFTGLCMCFMYAVNKFNLAGEGIFMLSGCIISLTAIKIGDSLPGPVAILVLFAQTCFPQLRGTPNRQNRIEKFFKSGFVEQRQFKCAID